MKPAKSAYWMVTIVLSYALLASIVSGAIGAATALNTSPVLEPFLRSALLIVGVLVAARHIVKRSVISPERARNVALAVGIVIVLFGALLSMFAGPLLLQVVINVAITVMVLCTSTYFFLNKAEA